MPQKKSTPTTIRLAVTAVFTSLVCVATMVIQVPIPVTRGYINIGDCMIFVSALLFGSVVGGFAGGVGSALADLFLGYPQWAPLTLIIKGTEGLIAGSLTTGKNSLRDIVAIIIAGTEMVTGYFIAEWYLYGFGGALGELPGNMFQAFFGAAAAIPLCFALRKRFPTSFRALKITLRS